MREEDVVTGMQPLLPICRPSKLGVWLQTTGNSMTTLKGGQSATMEYGIPLLRKTKLNVTEVVRFLGVPGKEMLMGETFVYTSSYVFV